MQSSPDFSGSLRRPQDSPNFWLAVLAGSLAVHLLFLLSGRWFLVRVAPVKSSASSTPIELVDLSPKSSGKPAQGVSLTAPKVTSAPLESSSGAKSPIQSSEPTQPTIVSSPSPRPIQERRLPPQPLPSPQKPAVTKPIFPKPVTPNPPPVEDEADPSSPPQPPTPSQPPTTENQTDPAQPSTDPDNPPKSQPPTGGTQTDPAQPSGDPDSPPKPPQSPSGGTQTDPPSGPITSGQGLPSTEVTIATQVTTSQIRRADPSRNDSQAKTAQLRGNAQQQVIVPYSPDFKLLPGQVLNLEVLFVVDTSSGKVVDSSVPANSTSLSDVGLEKLIDRVFEPLRFDVTFDTTATSENKAPLTAWIVPVQIQVVK
ncbi:hypothetical protein ACKFKF_29285 [Phormidesmis sp. 146-12]